MLVFVIEKCRDTYTLLYLYPYKSTALQEKDSFYDIYDRQNNNNSLTTGSIYRVSYTWSVYDNTVYYCLHFTNEETEAKNSVHAMQLESDEA